MGDGIKAAREQFMAGVRAEFARRFGEALDLALRASGAPSDKKYAELLAKRDVPVSQQDLSAWRKGRIPELWRMEEAGRAVGVNWQWLLTGLGERIGSGISLSAPVAQEPDVAKRPSLAEKRERAVQKRRVG